MIHCVSLCDMLLFSRDFSKPLYLLRGTHCHFIDILPSHYTCLTFCCLIEILASHFISLWLVPTRSLMHPVTKYLSDFADVGREKASEENLSSHPLNVKSSFHSLMTGFCVEYVLLLFYPVYSVCFICFTIMLAYSCVIYYIMSAC